MAADKICCVSECKKSREDGVILHKFPNPKYDPTRFQTWIQAVGGNLKDLEDMYVFKYRRICNAHFESRYWTRSKMLSNIAIPTLQMKGIDDFKPISNMDQNKSSKLLAICRTCLGTDANIPIFTEEMDAASYSDIVYTVTGLKVEIDDGLPHKICQNCLNSINNCLDFRKQCKNSEMQLLIIKTQVENSEYNITQMKSEQDDKQIKLKRYDVESHTSDEIEQNEITQTIENIKIIKEDNVTVPNIINDKQEFFYYNKNWEKKTVDSANDVRNVSDTNKIVDHIKINTVKCKLCKKMISKRKCHTHMTTKHNPTKNRNFMCNICYVYFPKNQFNHHKLTHRRNSHKELVDSDISLHNSISKNFCNDSLINTYNTSINPDIDRSHSEITNECILDTSSNNNNSTGKNFGNGKDNILIIINSIATDNENFCNYKQNIEDLDNGSIDSEVEKSTTNSNIVATEKEIFYNDETKQNNSLTGKVKNCLSNQQKLKNCYNDAQIVEKGFNNTEIEKTETENILYNYNSGNSKRVTCKLCQKDLSIRSVDSHISRSHPGADKRRVKCDLCDNYYVTKSKLIRHKTLVHGAQGFICRYCKSEFDDKEGLVEHIGSCSAKKKRRNCDASRELAECEVCHKTMQKGSLRLHIAMKHAGLRPVCEHCGLCFGNKFRLQGHYRAKHGYDKFKCSHCDFQSACNVAMRNHERRHRGEKPFVCERCGAKFHAAYLLAQHRQSHSATKAFQCDLCPASFKVNNTLHMHKRACHSARKYACTVCGRAFSARHYVVKHMRAMHRYTGPVPTLTPVE